MTKLLSVVLILLALTFKEGLATWCFRCTSDSSGCGENFDWRNFGFVGQVCPKKDDACVKITEKRECKITAVLRPYSQTTIIRDCLSAISKRIEIPVETHEGCRFAAKDVSLANYVNHTIKEDAVNSGDVEFCFCYSDNRCNGAQAILTSSALSGLSILSIVLLGLNIFN